MPPAQLSQVNHTKGSPFNESEDRFRKVFLNSSDALFITDTAGAEFLEANPRACQILGYSRRELLHLSPGRILSWKLGEIDWRQPMAEAAVKGTFYRQKSGLLISCDASARPVKFNQKLCTLLSVRPSTQRQLAETLRKTYSFARFLNAVASGVAEAPTVEQALRFCVHQVCDFRCWPLGHAHIFAKRFIAFRVPADIWYFGLGAHSESGAGTIAWKLDFSLCDWYPRIASTGRPFVSGDLSAEPHFAVKELARALKMRSALVVPLLVDKEVVGALEFFSRETMVLDKLFSEMLVGLGERVGRIIELKRARARVRVLSSRLFHLQDDERRRMARELHDTTAQHIAAILMDLNVLSRRTEALDEEARTALSECISLARQSLHEVRTFSYALHPPMLDELGLISALRIYIEGFSERSGMHVAFEPPDFYNKLPTDLEVTLFHVVQEGLTNAHRHSGSPWAKVHVDLRPAEISVSVENETTREVSIKNTRQNGLMGVGIRSLQERVEHFGGCSALRCNAYRTILEAVFPLSQAAKALGASN